MTAIAPKPGVEPENTELGDCQRDGDLGVAAQGEEMEGPNSALLYARIYQRRTQAWGLGE